MRRFEFSEGTSNKFWEIGLEGSSFTVVWGKIGTSGSTQTKSFASDTAAQKEHDKLVAEKLKKGYAEVGAVPATAAAAAKPKAPPAPKAAAPVPAAPPAPSAPAKAAPKAAAPPPVAPVPVTSAATTVVLSPELPHRATRAGKRAEWKKRTPAEAAKALAEAMSTDDFKSYQKAFEKGLSKAKGDCAKLQAAVLDAFKSKTVPAKVEARLWAATSRMFYGFDQLVRYWLDTAGPDPILQAIVASFTLKNGDGDDKLWLVDVPQPQPAADASWSLGGWELLRDYLLACDDATYARLRDVAAELRQPGSLTPLRATLSIVFPDETAWAQEDLRAWTAMIADPAFADAVGESNPDGLISAVTAALVPDALAYVKALDKAYGPKNIYWPDYIVSHLNDCLAVAGPAAEELVLFVAEIQKDYVSEDLAGVLAQIRSPKVAAFYAGLLPKKDWRPFATAYFDANPEVSVAGLAQVAAGKSPAANAARALIAPLLAKAGDLGPLLETLPPAARAIVDSLKGRMAVADASDADVPALLLTPPWAAPRQAAAPPKPIEGVKMLERPETVAFPPEELAELKEEFEEDDLGEKRDTKKEKEAFAELKKDPARKIDLDVEYMPALSAIYFLENADLTKAREYDQFTRKLLARCGPAVIPGILRLPSSFAMDVFDAMRAVDSPRTAPFAAEAMGKSKAAQKQAQEWLLKYPETAAVGLIPAAVGAPGRARTACESALRFLASRGHQAKIHAVAKQYGKEVEAAVKASLSSDALEIPAKLPKLPAFWKPASFARPTLKGGKGALPLKAVETLGIMLAISADGQPYGGIEAVKQACEPASLADFAWDLFQAWLLSGGSTKDGWAFFPLGYFGNDDMARRLIPLIRAWPGEAANPRAIMGLDVLAVIGTDVALMGLHGISQKVKFKNLQEKATEKIAQIAEARGLTADELADRLVPDLGLDDDGSLTLDFGPRQFRVTFDEALKPLVLDSTGALIGDLPKPAKADDSKKAAEATELWKAMKKDAKTIATNQVLRLELAMCGERRWPADVFRTFLLEHPLMIHLVRRLTWGVFDDSGKLTSTFRVAEDRSLASDKDETYTLPKDATVGIVHPLNLTDAQASAWGEIFANYKILQPFEQLGRPVFAPTAAEKKSSSLDRLKGVKIPTGKILGLEHRGWRRGQVEDAGIMYEYLKKLGGGAVVRLTMDEGIWTGAIAEGPAEQQVTAVSVTRNAAKMTYGELSPIAFSEIVRDLEQLRG